MNLTRTCLVAGLGAGLLWLGHGLAHGDVDDTDRTEAAAAAERAGVHADRGEFVAAAREFAAATERIAGAAPTTEADRELLGKYLFAWAKVEQLGGNCGCAVTLYDRFAALFPDVERWQTTARTGRAECGAVTPNASECHHPTGWEPPPPPPPPPAVDAGVIEAPPPPTPPPPAAAPRWYTDTLGGVLAVGGVAALGAGAWYFRGAYAAADDARAPGVSYDDYVTHADLARRDRTIGWIASGVGAALVAGAVVRYVMVGSRGPQLEVAPTAGRDGAVVGVGGSF
jgi:hypothetical protein